MTYFGGLRLVQPTKTEERFTYEDLVHAAAYGISHLSEKDKRELLAFACRHFEPKPIKGNQ
jgi:hypothetical protein